MNKNITITTCDICGKEAETHTVTAKAAREILEPRGWSTDENRAFDYCPLCTKARELYIR